jgi:hypothetical protein
MSLVQVKSTFEDGPEKGYVERFFSSNRKDDDSFAITDCIVTANNPKLQIANFSKIPVHLQPGQILGYMRPIEELAKESDLDDTAKAELASQANLLRATNLTRSIKRKEPMVMEEIDEEFSRPVKGGPKTAEMPELEHVPKRQLLSEVTFGPSLSDKQRSCLKKIVLTNHPAFGLDGHLGSHPAEVEIKLRDGAKEISLTPYSTSPAKREAIDKQLDEWIKLGVIQPSDSPWSFPIIVVYQNGKARVCVDYRRLNDIAVPDEHPLPKQTDILHALQGSQYLTTLDALAGFTQLSIKEEDRPKTAFRCHRGLFHFNRLHLDPGACMTLVGIQSQRI